MRILTFSPSPSRKQVRGRRLSSKEKKGVSTAESLLLTDLSAAMKMMSVRAAVTMTRSDPAGVMRMMIGPAAVTLMRSVHAAAMRMTTDPAVLMTGPAIRVMAGRREAMMRDLTAPEETHTSVMMTEESVKTGLTVIAMMTGVLLTAVPSLILMTRHAARESQSDLMVMTI